VAITVTPSQAAQCLVDSIKAKIVALLTGSPGTGKSSLIRAIAKEYKLKVIDFRLAQCDPVDLLGFPDINRQTGKASYVPMDVFPLEGDPVPEGYSGWLLFLDEANSADRAVQKAA
jgi:MoxR-like ATPase